MLPLNVRLPGVDALDQVAAEDTAQGIANLLVAALGKDTNKQIPGRYHAFRQGGYRGGGGEEASGITSSRVENCARMSEGVTESMQEC
jgi:hypothetical protein